MVREWYGNGMGMVTVNLRRRLVITKIFSNKDLHICFFFRTFVAANTLNLTLKLREK